MCPGRRGQAGTHGRPVMARRSGACTHRRRRTARSPSRHHFYSRHWEAENAIDASKPARYYGWHNSGTSGRTVPKASPPRLAPPCRAQFGRVALDSMQTESGPQRRLPARIVLSEAGTDPRPVAVGSCRACSAHLETRVTAEVAGDGGLLWGRRVALHLTSGARVAGLRR